MQTSPGELAGRVLSLKVGLPLADGLIGAGASFEFGELRCKFRVSKTNKKESNVCEVEIDNLASSTVGILRAKGMVLLLQAGYQGTGMGTLFHGDVAQVTSTWSGPTRTTRVVCGDGVRIKDQPIQVSLPSGHTPAGMMESAIKQLEPDVIMGKLKNALATTFAAKALQPGERGRAFTGLISGLMDSLVPKIGGAGWSIQDREIVVEPEVGLLPGVLPVLLNAGTGMVGSPEPWEESSAAGQEKVKGVRVRSLLQPQIAIGSPIEIDSLKAPEFNGLYKALNVQHEGDTHSSTWYTTIEAVPV